MLASFYYQTTNPLLAIKYASKAKEVFLKIKDMKLNMLCLNTLGLCCTKLKQFESAEEYFISALDTFKKYEQNN